MRDMKFSFGPRIHGNIAAILAGTPGVVLAHDGRTLELSKYHEIPTVDLNQQECPRTVDELYELTDFAGFNRGHAERFDVLSDFIHENGFTHIYDEGQEGARSAYEQKLAATAFPHPQKTLWLDSSPEEVSMISILQERHTSLQKKVKGGGAGGAALQKKVDSFESRLYKAEVRAAKAEAALEQTTKTLRSVTHTANRVERRQNKMLRVPLAAKRMLFSRGD